MKRYFDVYRFVLVAIVALSAASMAMAEERPLKIVGSGKSDHRTGDFVASGCATHLGQWTNFGNIKVSGEAPLLDVSGRVTFLAANGDELYALIVDGTLDVSGLPFLGSATLVIVGGAGRFADATGSGHMAVVENPDGSFTFTVDGTIDY